jgi:hypothetical protein
LGGGDPLSITETAVRQLNRLAQRRDSYATHVIFLDADKRDLVPQRTAQAVRLAVEQNLELIWQIPCHEAFLLRHLPGCERLQPPTPELAIAELRRRWPEYEKAMPAAGLAMRLDRGAVLRAANVDNALLAFLEAIEFYG